MSRGALHILLNRETCCVITSVYRCGICIHVYQSIYLQDKPNRSLNSPMKTHELQVLSNDLAEAKDRITQLEFQLDQALEEITEHKQNREIQVGSMTKNVSNGQGRFRTENLDVHFPDRKNSGHLPNHLNDHLIIINCQNISKSSVASKSITMLKRQQIWFT